MMADDPLMAGDVFTHAEAYYASEKTTLVALCDIDRSKLEDAGNRWTVSDLFEDAASMMAKAAPEIVSICTPTNTHLQIAQQLADSRTPPKAILCEKPLASALADAERLVAMAEEKEIVLATIYMRRYAENFRALKKVLDSGELGKIQAVSGWYIGGAFHNGTHWFDMLRFLVGEVTAVHGLNMLGETGADPTLDVALWTEAGALATLRACDANKYTLFEMDIVAESGRVQIDDSGHSITVSRAAPSPRYTGYTELQPSGIDFGHRRNLMLNAVEDAVDAVTLGHAPACTGGDGVAALRIADAAARSVKHGRVIELTR
jgi:predicted dehydrogenase